MSLFQCEHCGCVENTAMAPDSTAEIMQKLFDWTGIEYRKGKHLCSVCLPLEFVSGRRSGYGSWHHEFDRVFLPMGQFKTNKQGNLEHIETGSLNFKEFEIKQTCVVGNEL